MGIIILFAAAVVLIAVVGSAAIVWQLRHPRRKTYAVAMARGLPTSPGDLSRDHEETTFRFDDGSESPGWVVEGSDDAGPMVVVCHGWADSRYGALTWLPLLTRFASRIVLYDLRAHGDSTAKACTMGTRDVDDVLAVVRQVMNGERGEFERRNLRENPGARGVVLFGYSMGAGIAIAAAAREPELITGVIADGPYRTALEPLRGHLRGQNIPPWLFLPVIALTAPLVGAWRGFDRAALAAKTRCPLLVLAGTDDPISPHDSAQRIAAAAPHGELVSFEGAGHLELAGLDEPRYLESLGAFFAKLRTAADHVDGDASASAPASRSA